jgi:flagellar biogenesis protein FliO
MNAQAAASNASTAQFPQLPLMRDAERSDSGASLAWIGVVLLAVVAFAFVWKRRIGVPLRAGAGISVQPGRSLTTHASLHVVEWEGERLLVACTPQSVSVLARRPQAGEPA